MSKRSTKKVDYSTVVIVNRNNPNTKSISVRTKFLSRIKVYFTIVICVFIGLITSVVILTSEARKNASAKRELDWFKREIAGPLVTDTLRARSYIDNIESKLNRIQKYLKQRGVKDSQLELGGKADQGANSGVAYYRYYDRYLADLIKNLKYMPLGYPHHNHSNSRYGYRSNPFSGGGSEFHSGVDIKGTTGDPIKATANGTVIQAGWSDGYGNCVRIKHSHGYQTLYGHLSRISVRQGQKVKANQVIGALGSTGRSTGPHLHYEVRFKNKPINPERFLKLK
ncbi:MAG: M23 family metallopeptidase [Bacteroidetes bacterium]|nr:MAG: M23 family metallopeptidase [Bacteroidota bacterium]